MTRSKPFAHDDPAFTVAPARYAKNAVAVRVHERGDGLKGEIGCLCTHLAARYSGRERAYIMSPAKARRLIRLHAEGWTATIFGRLIAPGKLFPDD